MVASFSGFPTFPTVKFIYVVDIVALPPCECISEIVLHSLCKFCYGIPAYSKSWWHCISLYDMLNLPVTGLFITNLATRSTDLRNMVIAMMWSAFHTVLRISIPEDVNEILIGLPCKRDDIVLSPNLTGSAGSKEPPRIHPS